MPDDPDSGACDGPMTQLRFAEEIFVLLLSENSGALDRFSDRRINFVLAGATLMDLALENRVDSDRRELRLVDSTPVGDALLDPALAEIAKDVGCRDLREWIVRIAKTGQVLRTRTLARLVERGILESAEEGLLFLSSRMVKLRRYPAVSGEAEQDVLLRIMRLLFSEDIPDARDIVIVGLVRSCGLFESLLSGAELEEARPRIDLLSRMDLIGQAVYDLMREETREHSAPWKKAASRRAPEAAGLPFVGSALALSRDMLGFLVARYRELGPIYRLKLLNRPVTVLAGPEANAFVARYGHLFLTSHFAWRGYNAELGTTRSVVGLDGPEHVQMRRSLAYGYSRVAIEKRFDDSLGIMRAEVDKWRPGDVLPVYKTLQKAIIEQIGRVTTGCSAEGFHDELADFLDLALSVTVIGTKPGFLYRRKLSRLSSRIEGLYSRILEAHVGDEAGVAEGERSLISDVLDLHRRDPVRLPESDLKSVILSPFLAGLDVLTGTCSFVLYALLREPALMTRLQAETDEMFRDGDPDASEARTADVLRRVILETLRRYPVAPAVMRHVSNGFSFQGYRVDAGESVLVATGVPHLLPEYFPEPERFDIDRYLPDRAENRQRHVYTPFGLGAHRCLGSGFAAVQMAATVATIVNRVDLELVPRTYELRVRSTPTLRPEAGFRVKVARCRRQGAR